MAAPQLRLEVSLNLAGFRSEIQKLTNIAQSEFAPKINVKFNRRTLDTELNNLQAAIKRRVYRVEIGGNIDKLPDKIKALKGELSSLESFKIDLGIGAVKSLSKKDASKIKSDLRAEILGEQTKIYVPVSIKPSITREDVRNFKNTVKSKLTGLSVDVKANVQGSGFAGTERGAAGLMQYMQREGLLGKTASGMTMRMGKDGGDIKQQLSDAVGSAEKIKSIFDGVAQSIATTGKSIANVQGKRLGLANVPLMAGAMEKRIERSASAIEGTTSSDALKSLYPEINKTIVSLAALRGQVQQNTSKLSGFSLIIGLAAFAGVPLAKSIVKLTGSADKFSKLLDKLGPNLEAAFTKAAFNILNTASSRLLTGGSAAGLLPPAYRGIGPSAEPAGLLPPAYRGIGPSRNAGALPPAYRGLPFGFDFKGLPPDASAEDQAGGLGPTVQQMRQQLFSSIRIAQVRVREIFDIVGDFDSRQKAAGQAKLDKAVQDFVKGLEDITRRAILRGGVRQVNVADLGGAVRPALPSGRSPLMLPPAGGTTATDRIRVSTGAYLGQPGFMQAPSVPSPVGGGGAPPLPPRGGGGGAFGGMQFNMPQLPGAGLVREIGEEFGFAAKQVLLFGAAYKALAFIQSFPGQVGEAVGALQSFRNTIKEISPSAQEAADSSQFILDIIDKYNTPLQSARDGFVKLYASMQPAGFSGDEIRDLFMGISQTAATFGMSADKVDRVNYAFAQMASKGQVMSEELKGQLGDVLPGAMAIFAEAAGFKGPEAITKFSKALEDGAYKGAAMKVLLTNVGSIMRKEFGPGAEGAARTFQGVMNRMQNSLKLLYEAFEPVAVGFLNSVVMPMTSGLKTVTDGLNAFFTGAATKTSGGFAIAQELEKLRPTFDGLRENAGQLIQVFGQFAQVALGAGKVLLQIASNPFVGFMAKIYAIMIPLNVALGAMRGLWALNSLQLLVFNARIATGTTTLTAFRGMMAATGATAATTAAAIRAGFASTGIGIVLVGIGLLIERFMSMNQALADTKTKALGAADAIRSMSQTEARQAANQATRDVKILQTLQQKKNEGKAVVAVTKEEQEALERAGVRTGKMVVPGQMAKKGSLPELLNYGQQSVDVTQIQGALSAREGIAATANRQITDLRFQERQTQQTANIAPIPPGTGDGTGTKPPKEKSLESYYSLQDQLAKNFTQAEIDRLQAMHDQRMALQNEFFNQQEARANSFQKESIRFQRELASIENERKSALLKASLEVMQAQGSVMGGAAPTGAAVSGKTGLFQGSTGVSSGPHFDVRRQDGAYISPEQARALFDPSVRGRLAMTSAYGPRRAPVPGASTFHKGVDLAGPANTPLNLAAGYTMTGAGEKGGLGYAASVRGPQGEMYDVGHLQRPRAGAIAPRPVPGSEKRDLVAAQQVQIANSQRITTGLNAEELAYEKTKTAIANYVASIFSPEEQSLQNSLLAKRGELIRAGMDDDVIEIEMKRYEIQQKVNIGLVDAKKALDEKKIGQKQYNDLVAKLNNLLPASNKLLSEQNALLKDNAYGKRIEDLKEQIRLLLIINTEERRLAELTKEFNGDKVKAQEIFDLEKIKENIEATRALIGDFVSSTSSDYKGFLKAVISGEDAADALKQFQEGLKDRVLTIFLDFAMAPVEKFFKESLEGLFLPKAGSIPGLDAAKEATKDPVEATNSNTNATVENTQAIKDFTASMSGGGTGGSNQAAGFSAGMQDLGGVAFDGGNSSAIDTSLEGWNTALNTSISDSIKESTDKVKVEGATFKESLSKAVGAVGMAAGAIMGIAAGVSQVKQGGTSNVLGGIGSIMASIGGVLGGFGGLFGGGGGGGGLSSGFNAGTSSAVGTGSAGWASSFATPLKFANGGMVTGPTLGLIGEGKYNEAIVPLPDGRSIPVQFNQQSSLREAMAGGSNNASAPSVLSMTFESTNINGVEYVSRDQLEQAMAQTRRQASRDGAQRGMTMTLDKLQQSPSTRSRLGMR